jgi:hypothetical protein
MEFTTSPEYAPLPGFALSIGVIFRHHACLLLAAPEAWWSRYACPMLYYEGRSPKWRHDE